MSEESPKIIYGPYILDESDKTAITGLCNGQRVVVARIDRAQFPGDTEAEEAARQLMNDLNFAENAEDMGYDK